MTPGARERFVDVGGARLWLGGSLDAGARLPLLLCPGGPGCCDYLEPVAAMLEDLVEVSRVEPRGCGRSSPDGPFDLATGVGDLEAVREAIGAEPLAIGGHSAGANLALAYALEHPGHVRGLLYLAGNGLQDDRQWSAAYHAALSERGERQPDYPHPPNAEVNRAGNASWRVFIKQPDLWRRIAALDVPALVVVAGRDIRPDWPARQLAGALPRARLEVVEDAEHFLWLDAAPAARLRELLRDFVQTLASRSD